MISSYFPHRSFLYPSFWSCHWLGFSWMDAQLPMCSRKCIVSEVPPVRGSSKQGNGNFPPSSCNALVYQVADQLYSSWHYNSASVPLPAVSVCLGVKQESLGA